MEPLTPVEARVVGCLVEKQRTVPDTYPLTLNSLVSACNQSSSRDPIMHVDEGEVTRAIDGLKAKGLARIVHPGAGSRSTKYRHVLDEALGIEDDRLSLLAVLLLRGPQSSAELRSRTERLHAFADEHEVISALEGLAATGHVERDGRRWRQLLAPDATAPATSVSRLTETPAAASTEVGERLAERVESLEAEVAELRSVVDRLRDLLD